MFALLIVCFVGGVLASRLGRLPNTLAASLNWWVLHVALPATVLALAARLQWASDLWFLIVSMWCVFLAAWALFAALGHAFDWPQRRVGALVLVCGLGNTSFIGYPMIEALRGADILALAVVADQAGCFVALAVGGAFVTSVYGGSTVTAAQVARRVIFFPAFLALLTGGAAGALGGWPPIVNEILERIGGTLVPIALFAVGLQVRFELPAKELGALSAGLLYKLGVAPLLIYVLGLTLEVPAPIAVASTLQAAMAPMISAAVMAEQHDLEPAFANKALTLGIVLSFLSVPLLNSWL